MLNSPLLNKGTAFSREERTALGFTGLLPPEISTLGAQVQRAYTHYERLPDVLSKNGYLTALHDRNEVLFYRLFAEHLREMIPVVNDADGRNGVRSSTSMSPASARRVPVHRSPGGHRRGVRQSRHRTGRYRPDPRDRRRADPGNRRLGRGRHRGDSIGKLAVHTAAGGIDPTRVIPVMLDVGTNRESLLNDPMYIGQPARPDPRGALRRVHRRLRQNRDETVSRTRCCSGRDFAPGNGRRILEKYRGQICTFNDDMQGTGAITLAAAISAVRVCGTPLRNQRVVIFGAGTAGIGIADQIRDAMVREGLSKRMRRQPLLVRGPARAAHERHGRPVARLSGDVRPPGSRRLAAGRDRQWRREPGRGGAPCAADHADRRVDRGRALSPKAIVKEMAAHTERPIILRALHAASASGSHPRGSDRLDRRARA